MTVAVVLLNYPRYEPDTRRCLASLQRIPAPRITPIVVDYAAEGGGGDRVEAEFPDTVLLTQSKNLGFAGGNNAGIRYALEHGFDYVMLLNNDTEVVDDRIIGDMVAALEENRRIGMIGPRVFDAVGGEEQKVTLTAPSWTLRQRLLSPPAHPQDVMAEGTVSVEAISGVCWLVPARTFRSLGLLDSDIFLYGEDNEFCYRVRKAGLSIGQYQKRIGIHHYLTSKQIPSLGSLRNRMGYVNRLYALRKHGASAPLAIAWVSWTGFRLLGSFLRFGRANGFRGEGRALVRILRDLLRQLVAGRSSIRLTPADL